MKKKILIDTDIGTDVDDLLALVYALKNPEIEVVGITTVQGRPSRRAKIAKRVADLLEKDVKVVAGYQTPMNGGRVYFLGYEGDGIDFEKAKPEKTSVTDFLEPLLKDETVAVASIGPMTNLGKTLKAKKIPVINAGLYIMGAAGSHNFRTDETAARNVLAAATRANVVTTEVAKQVYLTSEEIMKIKTGVPELDNAIYANARNWARFSPYKGTFYLYDPLTVATAATPAFVATAGYKTKTTIRVAAAAFKEHFLEVLQS